MERGTAPALESRLAGLQPKDRLFPMTRRRFAYLMRKYGKVAQIPEHKRHPHSLKHSIAVHTIQKAGIENVRVYLGHKSMNSTGAYLRVDDEAASKAIGAAM